jgi:hypothetical protein
MNEKKRVLLLSSIIRKELLFSNRTKIMLPILLLFIPGFAWGFSDPQIVLPGGVQPDTAMEILYYTSIGILFSATVFAVLHAHDGISRANFRRPRTTIVSTNESLKPNHSIDFRLLAEQFYPCCIMLIVGYSCHVCKDWFTTNRP